jgi:hypothetical protein
VHAELGQPERILKLIVGAGVEDRPLSVDGRWRDVLSGREWDLTREHSVAELTDEHGLALLERLER